MVALAKTQVKNDVATVEELTAWCCGALFERHGSDRVQEVEGASLFPAVEYQLINAPGGELRLVVRVSMEVDRVALTDATQPIWKHVKAFPGNLTLPTGYAQA